MNVQSVDSNLKNLKNQHKFPYKWNLKDGYPAKNIKHHGKKVFSTFACGGGSSMGYKLAGYDVIGANDIDPRMEKVYKANHNPKYYHLSDIRDFNKSIQEKTLGEDFLKALHNLDILDGSPPCSTFSMAGSREKAWSKKKKFSEGQTEQVLDDLFFHFVETTRLLQPKVVIAENVKGIIQGNAKGYVVEIKRLCELAGYRMQVFLLNAASMGVPQKRERVFFIGIRNDLKIENKLKLNFDWKSILYKEIDDGEVNNPDLPSAAYIPYWKKCLAGKSLSTVHEKGHFFNHVKLSPNKVVNTIASSGQLMHHNQLRILTKNELTLAGSFPLDYDYMNIKPQYLIGMSVPPVMMAQVAHQVYNQILKDN